MKGYILKRLFHSIFVLVGISLVVFIILHLTGDPAALLMPMDATPEQVAQFRQEMGFNDPIILQYWRFFKGTLRGDFGQSFRHSQPALELVMERMPATIQLTLAAMVIALLVAIPVGIISAIRRNSILDHIGMTGALLANPPRLLAGDHADPDLFRDDPVVSLFRAGRDSALGPSGHYLGCSPWPGPPG